MDYDDVDDDDENACNQEFASKCKYGTEYLDWLRHQLLYKEVAYSMRFCSSFYFSFLLFFFGGGEIKSRVSSWKKGMDAKKDHLPDRLFFIETGLG